MPLLQDQEISVRPHRRGWLPLGIGLLALIATIALSGIGYLYWANTLPPREPDPRPAPRANAFDSCVLLGQRLKPIPIIGSEDQWMAAHAAAVREMSPAERAILDEVRPLTEQELRIPKDGDGQDPAFDPLNNLLRRVIASSKVALEDGDPATATDRAVTGLELGSRLGRGSLLSYGVISAAIARVIVARLEPCLEGMSAAEARAAGKRVQAVLDRLPSHAEVARGQRRYALARFAQQLRTGGSDLLPANSLPAFLNYPPVRSFLWSLYPKPSAYAAADEYYRELIREVGKPYPQRQTVPTPQEPLARDAVLHTQLRFTVLLAAETAIRLLRLELALEEYRKTHGQYPERLEALTPAVLPKLPNDPFSEAPFIYRRTASRYLLYSVGPDRKDDGGKRFLSQNLVLGNGDLVAGEISKSLPQQ